MQAFGIAADDAMSIVDKFNAVGNNFATTSGDIGVALQKSASAMEAANNSLDETIAIYTAAQTVVQDADTVGTALKTMSLRIRGATTELEQAGLDTDGMADSVSKLQAEIQSLTGVDIMLDDDKLNVSSLNLLKTGKLLERTTPWVRLAVAKSCNDHSCMSDYTAYAGSVGVDAS